MTASKAARAVATWLGNATVQKVDDYVVVSTVVRTTATRASSLETRTKLVAGGEVKGAFVWKELRSRWPATRESLGTWKIYVAIPLKKVKPVKKVA